MLSAIVLLCVEMTCSGTVGLTVLAQIETSAIDHFVELVGLADKNKDGRIDFDEFEDMGTSFIISMHLHCTQTHSSQYNQEKDPNGWGPSDTGQRAFPDVRPRCR